MKIKQLKEKTAQGLKDFLPKIGVGDIEGLIDALNDKLSKSQGGEINKPIVVTNSNSNHSITINPDGSIYVWNKSFKDNILTIKPSSYGATIGIEVLGRPLILNNVSSINNTGNMIFDFQVRNNGDVYARKFIKRYATDKDVLLGDGSTTGDLVKYIRIAKSEDGYLLNLISINDKTESFELPGATKELAGLMTAADKAKLDNIENTYLPLSGGTLTGTLYLNNLNSDKNGLDINNVNGIQSVDQDKVSTPEVWATDGTSIPINTSEGIAIININGKIDEDKIPNLTGYISSQDGNIYSNYDTNNGNSTLNVTGNYDEEGSGGCIALKRTEDGKGKLSIMLDGSEGSVNAETFKAITNPNENEVWCTDGNRLNVLNLLSNAAIYVAGSFALAEGGIDNTTVIDSPNEIIFDSSVVGGRFLARKGLVCYTHWKADISKNIAPPSRYGIETDNGVFPFNNQMYIFAINNYIYTAVCSNGTCTMKKLTL